jgi:ribosomal protein S27AE
MRNAKRDLASRGTASADKLSDGRLAKLHPISQSRGVNENQPIAPVCPRCGDPMRLARKFPPLKPLPEMRFYLCGRCGNVETIDNSQKASP